MQAYTRIYAIRMGDYVEFRSSAIPPVAKTSTLKRPYLKIREDWDDTSYPSKRVERTVKAVLVLKQVFYVGGKVLGVCRLRQYCLRSKQFGLPMLYKDQMIEVPRELLRSVKRCA